MIIARFISWLFAVAITFYAIDTIMMRLADGKFPEPISYHRWTQTLLNGR